MICPSARQRSLCDRLDRQGRLDAFAGGFAAEEVDDPSESALELDEAALVGLHVRLDRLDSSQRLRNSQSGS
jgi:hypothetical protein